MQVSVYVKERSELRYEMWVELVVANHVVWGMSVCRPGDMIKVLRFAGEDARHDLILALCNHIYLYVCMCEFLSVTIEINLPVSR